MSGLGCMFDCFDYVSSSGRDYANADMRSEAIPSIKPRRFGCKDDEEDNGSTSLKPSMAFLTTLQGHLVDNRDLLTVGQVPY